MIYRKKQLDKFILKFLLNNKTTIKNKINKSFKQNYSQRYTKRINFYIQKLYSNKNLCFYNSQNKLNCFITYSSKVPNSKLLLSRFFLVKNVNKLLIGGFKK